MSSLLHFVLFHAAEFKYIEHQNMDCLFGNNLHVLISSRPEVDCNNWCINNIINCGGYTAYNTTRYPNRCYFKNKSCKNNLFNLENRTVFIAQGKFNQDELTILLLCLIIKQAHLQVAEGRKFYINHTNQFSCKLLV